MSCREGPVSSSVLELEMPVPSFSVGSEHPNPVCQACIASTLPSDRVSIHLVCIGLAKHITCESSPGIAVGIIM